MKPRLIRLSLRPFALLLCALSPVMVTSAQDGWVTVTLPEFPGAINNPLKGFRDYTEDGYRLLRPQCVKWNEIELSADDSVERIIAHTNRITTLSGRRFEDLNITFSAACPTSPSP